MPLNDKEINSKTIHNSRVDQVYPFVICIKGKFFYFYFFGKIFKYHSIDNLFDRKETCYVYLLITYNKNTYLNSY